MTDKIIELKPHPKKQGEESAPIKQRPRHQRKPIRERCFHPAFEVDPDERRVFCLKCKVELDPIKVLVQLCQFFAERDYKEAVVKEYERLEAEGKKGKFKQSHKNIQI